MSRLFKNNSSPQLLPVPSLPKSPVLQHKEKAAVISSPPLGMMLGPQIGMLSPQIVSKSANFKAVFASPPGSPTSSRRGGGEDNKIGGSLILNSPSLPKSSIKSAPKQVPVFGSPLSSLLAFDSTANAEQVVPFLVEECICYLNRDEMLKVEGIFRQSGKSTEVQDVKRSYDAGKYITLFNITDVHVVSGLLKLYLRSLPEPVVPFSSYDAFITFQKTRPKDLEGLRKLINEIPLDNKILLKCLCSLLRRASTFEKNSKMNANSLSIVIGPNIMRSENVDMMKAMEESPLINYLTATMIENSETLFTMQDTASYDLSFFTTKRKRAPPVYLSFTEFQVKLEERKKTRSFLAAWFQKRQRPEDLVKRKIFTEFDMAGFRNSREYAYGQF